MGTADDDRTAPMHATATFAAPRRLLTRHQHLGALAVLTAVIGGTYAPVLAGIRSLLTNGPWTQPLFVLDPLAGGPATAPLTRLAATAWVHLHLPIIDPFQGFGVPLLDNQGVPVYPPQLLLHLLFPSNYSIWNVVDLLALAFGVYLLARAFGQGFPGAVAAGFLASLAGAAPPNVNMSMLDPLAVLPFVLVAARYAVDPDSKYRRIAFLGVATSVSLLCLSGFPEVLPLMAAVLVVFSAALVVHFGAWRRPGALLALGGSAAAGVIIGSVGLLPTLSLVGTTTSLNGPTSYLPHVPTYWLSTLVLPSITDRALNQAPQDLGNTVFTLGTPLLVLVVVLAAVIAVRQRTSGVRWYVLPSLVLVVYGVLGYADVGGVLHLFDVPVLDAIQTRRFLQFAWWIPLCLLLGAVVSHARVLRWKDVLAAVLAAGAVDAYFLERYRAALADRHVASDTASLLHAPIVAGATIVVFALAALAARRYGPATAGVAMAAIVLASCLYDLPTNLPPASHGSTVTAVPVPGVVLGSDIELAYFATRQLPTEQHSFQIYGPLIPTGYRDAVSALFSVPESGGLDPIGGALPTLAQLELTPRAISVLRSFGVNLLVVPHALSPAAFPTVPDCAGSAVPPHRGICSLGSFENAATGAGYAPARDVAYRILGAHPLVARSAQPVPVSSTRAGIEDLTRQLSASTPKLPASVYVTTGAAHVRAARDVRGVARTATTQVVSITLKSRTSGTAILREAYEPGVRASVDGRRVAAHAVDGGLWTAVHVPAGASVVTLDYTTTADIAEFALAGAGILALAVGWVWVAAVAVRRRKRTPAYGPTPTSRGSRCAGDPARP